YSAQQVDHLRTLGVCMNYNGYGASLDDLFYHPADLYRIASQYESPFNFIKNEADVFSKLKNGYEQDMAKALAIKPIHEREGAKGMAAAIFILPNEKWARRISGVLGNELANRFPNRAHAILTERAEKNDGALAYQVSIRAPKINAEGADDVATKFGGGGRKGAAGIDVLLKSDVDSFYSCFELQYT
ncbi:MAG: DHH family phosphoesterase, partial [Colwellia sp.]